MTASHLTPHASRLSAPSSRLRPAVFLDRDGTLNVPVVQAGQPYPPATLEEFVLYPDAAESCRRLHAAGYVLVVATNQPDVGRGTQTLTDVEVMHAHLRKLIPEITRIEVCYAPGQGIDHPANRRRKPAPGMLLDAAAALGLDLAQSWMIGDRWRDIDCGARAGCRTIFIDWDYAETLRAQPDFTVRSLAQAVGIILAQSKAIS
ncbi:MAG: HAD-IIIA family hydrolase [Opitutaceae bacterium]|nr:HAD-IIIA family hydrolase [Opitutaceae bacterium]MBP9912830.1 HAD-IIIA family hydrolase [Opitutaceae bacterium]